MRIDLYKHLENKPAHTFVTTKEFEQFASSLDEQKIGLFQTYDVAINDMIVYGWDELELNVKC